MIERFNFFDIYAYLLPGAAFLGLIWLPFGIVCCSWPSADLSSALLSLVAAYIVGHILYYPAKAALPSEDKGHYAVPPGAPLGRAKPSHPSDFILDAAELTYPLKFKEGLQGLINERFKDDVQVNIHCDLDGTDKAKLNAESEQRKLAFFLCRSALVTGKVASYGEQFEGLYQVMRSLTVVFALGFFYHFGWALALWVPVARCLASVAAALVALAIVGAAILARWQDKVYDPRKLSMRAWMTIGLLMLVLLLCPFFLRWSMDSVDAAGLRKVLFLAGIALTDLFAWSRCSSAYKPFAWEFARAIYRDFYVYAKCQGGADAGTETE